MMIIELNLKTGGTVSVNTDDIVECANIKKGSSVLIEKDGEKEAIEVYEACCRIKKLLNKELV